MNILKYQLCCSILVMMAGCSLSQGDDITSPNEVQPPTQEEEDTREYDSRFPFAVWTDQKGLMHFDVDFETGSADFPAEKALLENIVGKGWEICKTYIYQVELSERTGNILYQNFKEIDGWNITGLDALSKFFFNDNNHATIYYSWAPEGHVSPRNYVQEKAKYSYNSTTGIIDFQILKGYKVIFSDKENLWKGRTHKAGTKDILEFTHLKRVSTEVVAQWNTLYKSQTIL